MSVSGNAVGGGSGCDIHVLGLIACHISEKCDARPRKKAACITYIQYISYMSLVPIVVL